MDIEGLDVDIIVLAVVVVHPLHPVQAHHALLPAVVVAHPLHPIQAHPALLLTVMNILIRIQQETL